jgi:hypothetical protein
MKNIHLIELSFERKATEKFSEDLFSKDKYLVWQNEGQAFAGHSSVLFIL